ncbi:restriction endonuclease subunit S [Photorhabdus kayaii]|uniref:restriction endonuclease subunit S n=1 Tax=Photorhabdus kayaii TaxID=230088 RepID=UPI0021D4DD40|nr:restriction endonuclease subunit S [Photorhabdus kayaii]MCT8352861.1 restriction endonuclease subunit S [Photorhabdus kayaii]
MSNMSFMEKLLEGVEVEWESLEQVAKIKHGKDWKRLNSGDIPVYGSGGIMGYVDTYSYNKPTVLIPRKGSITNIFYIESPFWNVDTIYYTEINTKKIIPKFLYYFIKTIDLLALDTGSGRPSLTQAILNKIQIPIPSLDIQTEIVRILDTFTELTAKLTAELTARKKQYNYYRDQLLSFEESEVEWKTLGEIGEFIRGNGMQKKDFIENGFPAIHYGQIYTRYGLSSDITFTYVSENLAKKLRKANENDLLLATTSENDEDVVKPLAWLGGQVAISGDMMLFRNEQNVKYLAYYFQTEAFQAQKRKYITGTKVRRVSKSDLEKILVPIPSLAEQARIVSTLDKFDALTNSISEGLPREIELRQKQYEYYRDLLLSFPKPEVAA